MRANGVAERYCTGDAEPYEKFLAWAATVPRCLRNPLYHWTHLELKRYFGIDDLLDETTAPGDLGARKRAAGVRRAADARHPEEVRRESALHDRRSGRTSRLAREDQRLRPRDAVYPTFRPDRALDVHVPDVFNPWVDRLSAVSNTSIVKLADFLDALRARHEAFHDAGGRLSDHGLSVCYADPCTDADAAADIRQRARRHSQHARTGARVRLFHDALLRPPRRGEGLDEAAAPRRAAQRQYPAMRALGRDTGFDSIGDWPQAEPLGAYLDRLDQEDALPKIIVYNLNPADNYALATMIGNFQDGSLAGKIQFGSGWWFLDQKEGIEWQMNALSNAGLLARFVGMLTDSRSFMSYPRHEYFRRVLCNMLGEEMENGELPADEGLVGGLVEDVSFRNASRYFGWG